MQFLEKLSTQIQVFYGDKAKQQKCKIKERTVEKSLFEKIKINDILIQYYKNEKEIEELKNLVFNNIIYAETY